jgi:hypothetical protein
MLRWIQKAIFPGKIGNVEIGDENCTQQADQKKFVGAGVLV